MNIENKILDFERSHKNFAVAYGGDGTLLDVARRNGFKKAVIPIRNYGLCKKHETLAEDFFSGEKDISLKQTIHPLLRFETGDTADMAAAEITVKNCDTTACMRFDLSVNDRLYMENVICDGAIFATSMGSHGYFKSVTRTIFSGDCIGIGFIAPTYGINNLVLKLTDKVAIRFRRDTVVTVSADKSAYKNIAVPAGSEISVLRIPANLSLFGYDLFCCPECRRNRNSTVINDQYLG